MISNFAYVILNLISVYHFDMVSHHAALVGQMLFLIPHVFIDFKK